MFENRGPISLGFIIVGGLLLTFLTLEWSFKIGVAYVIAFIFGTVAMTTIFFMTSVRFYSPLAVGEDGHAFTTFDNRVEIVHDDSWNMDLAIVFVGGYLAPKRLLSAHDIAPGGKATLIVVPDPRMIESLASGRFLLIRGTPYECGPYETREFLNRSSIKAALGDEVRSARVLWCFASKTLKPDVIPSESTELGELANLWETWHGEVEETVTKFSEEFIRKFTLIKDVKLSPVSKLMEKQKTPLESEKEEKQRE